MLKQKKLKLGFQESCILLIHKMLYSMMEARAGNTPAEQHVYHIKLSSELWWGNATCEIKETPV